MPCPVDALQQSQSRTLLIVLERTVHTFCIIVVCFCKSYYLLLLVILIVYQAQYGIATIIMPLARTGQLEKKTSRYFVLQQCCCTSGTTTIIHTTTAVDADGGWQPMGFCTPLPAVLLLKYEGRTQVKSSSDALSQKLFHYEY